MHLIDPPIGTFTTQDMARLTAYRNAIASGFFTDWDGSDDFLDTHLLAWLPPAEEAVHSDAYPFTTQERSHLEQLRTAVVAGRYADDTPPTSISTVSKEGSEASTGPMEDL